MNANSRGKSWEWNGKLHEKEKEWKGMSDEWQQWKKMKWMKTTGERESVNKGMNENNGREGNEWKLQRREKELMKE